MLHALREVFVTTEMFPTVHDRYFIDNTQIYLKAVQFTFCYPVLNVIIIFYYVLLSEVHSFFGKYKMHKHKEELPTQSENKTVLSSFYSSSCVLFSSEFRKKNFNRCVHGNFVGES